MLLDCRAARGSRFIEYDRVGRVHIVDGGSLGHLLQGLIRFDLGQELAKVPALNLIQLESLAFGYVRTGIRILIVGLVAVFLYCKFSSGCSA